MKSPLSILSNPQLERRHCAGHTSDVESLRHPYWNKLIPQISASVLKVFTNFIHVSKYKTSRDKKVG